MKNKIYPDNIFSDIFGTDEYAAKLEQYMALQYLLIELSEDDRLIIRLIYELSIGIDKASEIIGISVNELKQKLESILNILSTDENKTRIINGIEPSRFEAKISSDKKGVNTKTNNCRVVTSSTYLYKDYPNNLIFTIKGKYVEVNDNMINNMLDIINKTDNSRTREIIITRYRDKETIKSIAHRYNISQSRVSQIIVNFIRQCRQPINIDYLDKEYKN